MARILLFGGTGGIGQALMAALVDHYPNVHVVAPIRPTATLPQVTLSNTQTIRTIHWDSPDALGDCLAPEATAPFDMCLCAIGGLHQNGQGPEKKLAHITPEYFQWATHCNTVLPAMVIKHCAHLMAKQTPSVMGILSARVGSIGDNRLGGWYSYRAAKAALNMIIKSAAIEMKRYNKNLSIVGIHPGTVDTALSAPFQSHVAPKSLFSPQQSATYILNNIVHSVGPEQSGQVFAWDGQRVPE
jgi:NAD(P)-dependent dehydrogenase (short-subunit alcohol dehydrogenase family)